MLRELPPAEVCTEVAHSVSEGERLPPPSRSPSNYVQLARAVLRGPRRRCVSNALSTQPAVTERAWRSLRESTAHSGPGTWLAAVAAFNRCAARFNVALRLLCTLTGVVVWMLFEISGPM